MYVLNASSDSITPVDTLGSPQSESAWLLPSGFTPTALAVAPDGLDAYVTAVPLSSSGSRPVLWEVELVGANPGAVIDTINLPEGSSPAGVALTPSGVEALVTDFSGGALDPVCLSVGGSQCSRTGVGTPVPVGAGPQGIQVSPDGDNAYVANSEGGSISQVNIETGTTTQTVELESGYQPQQIAITPSGMTAWVTEDSATSPTHAGFAVPVSIPEMSVGSPIAVGGDPNGVAVAPDGSMVYVADETETVPEAAPGGGVFSNAGSITVIPGSAATGGGSTTVTTLLTAEDPADVVVTPDEAPVAGFTESTGVAPAGQATTFDASSSYSVTPPDGTLDYTWTFGDGSAPVSTPNSSISHVYLLSGSYQVTLQVQDSSGSSTAVVYTGQYVLDNGGPSASSTTSITVPGATVQRPPNAFVVDSLANEVTPILADPHEPSCPDESCSNAVGTPIPVGRHPDAVAITPNGETAYVANFGSNNVTPINTASDSAGTSASWIAVGNEPDALAITPDGRYVYVANAGSGTISKISTATSQVTSTIAVGGTPSAIAISPDGLTAYVTDNAVGFMDVIPINLNSGVVEAGIALGDVCNTSPNGAVTSPIAVNVSPDGSSVYVLSRGSTTVPGALTTIAAGASAPAGCSPAVEPSSTLTVGRSPSSMAVSPDGSEIVVTTEGSATVPAAVYETSASEISFTPYAASVTDPTGVAIDPSNSAVYVTNDVPAGDSASGVSVFSVSNTTSSATLVPAGTGTSAIAITPDQAPVADLTVTAAPAGDPWSFDASQSTFPSSPGQTYLWNFGDGSSETTSVDESVSAGTLPAGCTSAVHCTHTYQSGGTFTASVTITDADGTSTASSFTGQTDSWSGSPSATASQTISVPFATPIITSLSQNYEPAGAGNPLTVIIHGEDFTGATSVEVLSAGVTTTIATFPADTSDTEVSDITMPSQTLPGTVDLRVVGPGGVSAITSHDAFTYLPSSSSSPDAPTVTSLSADQGANTGGDGLTITGTNFSGASAVEFASSTASTSLSPAAFTVSASGTQITLTTPSVAPMTGSVDVRVVTAEGTSAVTRADAFTFLAPTQLAPLPTVTSLSPDSGRLSGQNDVTINGTNLGTTVSLVSEVYFGSLPAESFTFTPAVGSTPAYLTAVAPPVAHAQSVDVTVVSAAGTSAVNPGDDYTYVGSSTSAGPVVTSVTPDVGSVTGGETVTIEGSNFENLAPGAVTFGGIPATFSVYQSGTEISATVPPGASIGVVDVVVTNPLGSSIVSPADQFNYESELLFAPSVTSVTPPSSSLHGGVTVTLTGKNFAGATAVDFGSMPGTSVVVSDSGDVLTVTAPASPVAQTVDVTVTNPFGTSARANDGFTYRSPPSSAPGPSVEGVSPSSGSVLGGTGVQIAGSGFTGATAVDFGSNAALSFTVNPSGTVISAITSPATSLGAVDVTVTAGGVTSLVSPLDVYYYTLVSNSPPIVTNVSPNSTYIGASASVTVTGWDFADASQVLFGNVPGTHLVVAPNGESLTVDAPISHAVGSVDVTIVGPTGTSAVTPHDSFTYEEPVPAPAGPVVTGLSSHSGPLAGGTVLSIEGTGLSGATSVQFGANAGTNLVSVGDGSTSLRVTVPAATTPGPVDVIVTTPAGTSAITPSDAYDYVASGSTNSGPTVTGLSASSGSVDGGDVITITGTDLSGLTAVTFGGAPSTGLNALGADSVTAKVPPHAAGTVDVIVTTTNGSSAPTIADNFTFVDEGDPDITSVSPPSGSVSGATSSRSAAATSPA